MGRIHKNAAEENSQHLQCPKSDLQTNSVETNDIRKKIFYAFALPHFMRLFVAWFYYTDSQQKIEHLHASGLRIVYNLWGWDDFNIYVTTREKTRLDYLYSY